MARYTEISSVANTLKKFHIQSNLHNGYKHSFYDDKQDKFDKLFDQYHIPLLKYIYYPELIQEWKKYLDADSHEKNKPGNKAKIKEEIN